VPVNQSLLLILAQSHNPVLKAVLGHWHESGIATFASGAPQSMGFSTITGVDLIGAGDGQRIDISDNPNCRDALAMEANGSTPACSHCRHWAISVAPAGTSFGAPARTKSTRSPTVLRILSIIVSGGGVMPIDMIPARFFDELQRIKPFQRHGQLNSVIQKASLPAKQAFLPGLFLFNHAAGYRLPEWEDFKQYYVAAVHKHKNYAEKFAHCFTSALDDRHRPVPKPGLLFRMSGWYEDSMAHAFLYSVLVLAYEDTDHVAFVLYDARADWKFKADFIILQSTGDAMTGLRVSIEGQNEEDRARVELQRDNQERTTKANAAFSSHWANQTYNTLPLVRISRQNGTPITRNGFQLFNIEAMERLLTEVDSKLIQPRIVRMPVNDLLVFRPPRS